MGSMDAELSLELINQERQSRGLSLLQHDTHLMEASQGHADDMAARGYYAHVSPEGTDPLDRFVGAGGSRSLEVKENIGYCRNCTDAVADLVRLFHEQWMASPGHRENILDPQARRFGFGMAFGGGGQRYAVQGFAGPGKPRARTSGVDPTELTSEAQQPFAIALVNARRAAHGVAELGADSALGEAARQLLGQQLAGGNEGLAALSPQALRALLPPGQRERWRSLGVMVMACGGCGDAPTDADIEYFIENWAESDDQRVSLVDGLFGWAGFALLADGYGRKVAMLVLAADR